MQSKSSNQRELVCAIGLQRQEVTINEKNCFCKKLINYGFLGNRDEYMR